MDCQYNYKGQWLTEAELLNHPDFTTSERDYINGNTAENSDSEINFFSAETTTGVFDKFIKFKETQLIQLNQRLNQISTLKKDRDITQAELTRLNNLERQIKMRIEGKQEFREKGLKQEIEELKRSADINAVGYYATRDLQRLEKLSKSTDIGDLREAQALIEFYTLAGTFAWDKRKENPFFTEREIFLEDEDGNLTEHFRLSDDTMQQFKDWRNKAEAYKSSIDKREEEVTVNYINSDPSVINTHKGKEFNLQEVQNKEKGLKDADWISMWTMDVTQGIWSHNGILPQVMFSYLVNSFEKKLAWARGIEEKIDKINPGVQKELRRLGYSLRGVGIIGLQGASYQIFKEITKQGNETGGLVQRFSKEFYDAQSSALNKFSSEYSAANLYEDYSLRVKAYNKAFTNLKQWRRANTIIMEISKVPELSTSTPETEAYKASLVELLGEKGYQEQVEKQRRLLVKYEAEKQSSIDFMLEARGVATYDELAIEDKNDIAHWVANNDPMLGIQDFTDVAGISFGERKTNSYMRYNSFIPRDNKVDVTANAATGKFDFTEKAESTGHHNKTFFNNKATATEAERTIEGNPILQEFYDVIKEVSDVIRENTPYELQKNMAANTLPALLKTSNEMIADKSTGILSSLSLAFWNIIERIRLSFGVSKQSDVSYAIINPTTGRPNYKVNDGFLRQNSSSVAERMSIEKAAFIQAYNQDKPTDQKLKNLRRFSVLPISKMDTNTLILLAKYLNVDISMADIDARRISAITNITGENVEIGKFIRDYSVHTVVQTQSFDLAKIGKYFSNVTMAFAARQEALPILEIMKKHYQQIEKPKVTNTKRNLFNKLSGKNEMSGLRTNANQQMDDWFERVVLDNYGIPHEGVFGSETRTSEVDGEVKTKIPFIGRQIYTDEEKAKIKEINKLLSKETNDETKKKLEELKAGFGKERTATAIIDNLLTWIRTLRLGYNISSATTNFLEGVTSNIVLAAQSQFFDPKELYYGYGVVKHSFLKNASFGYLETPVARKNRKLMDKFNVIMDSKNELQKSSHKTYASKLSWMNPHELNQRVEYINQSPIMIAMLRTEKIKDINGNEATVWSAMTTSGHLKDEFKTEENINNWENLSGPEYLSFKQKLHKAIVLAHGNYDELRGMMIKSNTAGKALMMFKTWIPMQLYWRFATEQDDLQMGTKGFKGRYRSYGAGSALIHGAAIGAVAFGPFGAVAGAVAGLAFGGIRGTDSGIGVIQQSVSSALALAKRMIGLPVNIASGLVAGKRLINTEDKAFDSWVKPGGTFTEQDARNLRANMADISIQLMWLALLLVVKSALWDDEPKSKEKEEELYNEEVSQYGEEEARKRWMDRIRNKARQRATHNVAANKLIGLSDQGAMYVNPVAAFKSTLGSMAIVQYLTDVAKEVKAIGAWMTGEDITVGGINSGESQLMNSTSKILLPGLFKDVGTLGLKNMSERVFTESYYHKYFKSEAVKEETDNKRERAERKLELKKEGKLFDNEIQKILDKELPTPAKLKKLEMTREEYEAQLQEEE